MNWHDVLWQAAEAVGAIAAFVIVAAAVGAIIEALVIKIGEPK